VPYAANAKVDAYIAGVLSGEVRLGYLARLAVERQVADLDRWPAATQEEAQARGDPFWFDPVAAQDLLDFYSFCRHVEGELAGEPFDPLPWQAFVDWVCFGWRCSDTGGRRFRERWMEVCRGNGKSYWMSANADYMLIADGEAGAKVFAIATKEDQATVVWGVAAEIVKQSPELSAAATVQESVNNRRIFLPGTFSVFKPLPSDPKKADSLNPHAVYLDELHEWRNRTLYMKMKTAMGKRLQPMLSEITTAGDDDPETLYEELRDYAIRVLKGWQHGDFRDERFFAVVYCLDDEDDPYDEATWVKGNPSLGARGASVRIEHLREMANRAHVSPDAYRDFLRMHCGRRVSTALKAISEEAWDACRATAENGGEIVWTNFAEFPCYAALDLSSTVDLTALTLYWPPHEPWPYHTYRFFAWLPAAALREACQRDMVPYDQWVEQGWLQLTPGNQIDDRVIAAKVRELAELYQVQQWCNDPWHAVQLGNRLQEECGIEVVSFMQDLKNFGEPTMLYLDELHTGKMRHDGNPLARWCAGNVVTKEDAHGNRRPHKKASRKRIDPIVAAIMARGRAVFGEAPTDVYDGHLWVAGEATA